MPSREAILAAAKAAFDRGGLDALSLRKIARVVGVTPMAIYRHFEDKDDIVDAIVLDGLAEWSARVAALSPQRGLDRLEQVSEAYLDFALTAPRRFEAAFLLTTHRARRFPDDFATGRSPAGNIQLRAIEEAMAEGRLANAPPVELMMMFAALGQGLVSLYRAGRVAGGEDEFRTLYRRAMRRMVRSFSGGNM